MESSTANVLEITRCIYFDCLKMYLDLFQKNPFASLPKIITHALFFDVGNIWVTQFIETGLGSSIK